MIFRGQRAEDTTSDLDGGVCQPSRMASSSIRRQSFCRGFAAQFFKARHTAVHNHQSSERGFSLIELIVVVIVVVILATALLERVWFYQEQAEKAAMVAVAATIQTALVMQYGRLITRGVEREITALATGNPMNWLAKQPRNYSGEYYDPTPRSVSPGSWMFDLKTRELIYVPDRTEHFVPGKDGKNWIRYRVNIVYEPDARGKSSSELVGTLFEPTEPYHWFDGV